MFWLIWQMGILLLLAIAAGVAIGHQIWSGDARSAEADKALSDNARLRQENENLARRLGEVSVQPSVKPADPAPVDAPKAEVDDKAKTDADAPAAKPVPKPASPAGQDDLTRIKGLGPKAAAALQAGGITRIAQIADWSDTDIEVWDDRINGRGRIVRDDWVGQARNMIGEAG
jgi:predicted flap endonuclease-1-like 5' DNA nuclease